MEGFFHLNTTFYQIIIYSNFKSDLHTIRTENTTHNIGYLFTINSLML